MMQKDGKNEKKSNPDSQERVTPPAEQYIS